MPDAAGGSTERFSTLGEAISLAASELNVRVDIDPAAALAASRCLIPYFNEALLLRPVLADDDPVLDEIEVFFAASEAPVRVLLSAWPTPALEGGGWQLAGHPAFVVRTPGVELRDYFHTSSANSPGSENAGSAAVPLARPLLTAPFALPKKLAASQKPSVIRLAAFAAPQVLKYLGTAKVDAAKAQVQNIASILDLYDPDRSQAVVNLGRIRTWEAFIDVLSGAAGAQEAKGGAGLRILNISKIATGAVT